MKYHNCYRADLLTDQAVGMIFNPTNVDLIVGVSGGHRLPAFWHLIAPSAMDDRDSIISRAPLYETSLPTALDNSAPNELVIPPGHLARLFLNPDSPGMTNTARNYEITLWSSVDTNTRSLTNDDTTNDIRVGDFLGSTPAIAWFPGTSASLSVTLRDFSGISPFKPTIPVTEVTAPSSTEFTPMLYGFSKITRGEWFEYQPFTHSVQNFVTAETAVQLLVISAQGGTDPDSLAAKLISTKKDENDAIKYLVFAEDLKNLASVSSPFDQQAVCSGAAVMDGSIPDFAWDASSSILTPKWDNLVLSSYGHARAYYFSVHKVRPAHQLPTPERAGNVRSHTIHQLVKYAGFGTPANLVHIDSTGFFDTSRSPGAYVFMTQP